MTVPSHCILAIDQGTTNSKAILVNTEGEIVSRGQAAVAIAHPKPGWVEQDPAQIWHSVTSAISECLLESKNAQIKAIGISNQRESILAWDRKSGNALGPCITWQCRRTKQVCNQLKRQGFEPAVKQKTGLPIDPLFPGSKVAWLLNNIQPSQRSLKDICVGTVDSWLLWHLSGGQEHACDASNASRTQLFNIQTGKWDRDLCDWFEVPMSVLPRVRPSNALFGKTSSVVGLADGIPINGMLGDSHAALFGHGIHTPGSVKATYGTGSSLMTLIDNFIQTNNGITTTIAWQMDGKTTYALEGNIFVSASSLEPAAEWFGLQTGPEEISRLAFSVDSSEGVYFVPALVGLGAPHWNSAARGLFTGMTFNTKRAHLARAVMESIVFQVLDVFGQMNELTAVPLTALLADGGPSQNDQLMGLQSNLLGLPVVQRDAPEISALGAAFMAGIGAGVWEDYRQTATLIANGRPQHPTVQELATTSKIKGWHQAVQRSLLFERDDTKDGPKLDSNT